MHAKSILSVVENLYLNFIIAPQRFYAIIIYYILLFCNRKFNKNKLWLCKAYAKDCKIVEFMVK